MKIFFDFFTTRFFSPDNNTLFFWVTQGNLPNWIEISALISSPGKAV